MLIQPGKPLFEVDFLKAQLVTQFTCLRKFRGSQIHAVLLDRQVTFFWPTQLS